MRFSTAEWRDEAKHAWTQVDELRAEIERLREDLRSYEDHIYTELDCPHCDEKIHPSVMSRLFPTITHLRKRIEELEKQNDERLKIWNESITIPRDKIREAWKEANATSHLKYQNVTLLRFLERHFNIVRCEGVVLRCLGDTCPRCNGEGWVVKDD